MAIGLATSTTRHGEEREQGQREHDWSGLEPWRATLVTQLQGHCRDANEVEDIVQETFLRAARHRRCVRSPDRFGSWLLRIAFNALRDLRRRSRTLPLVPLEEAHEVSALSANEPESLYLGPWVVEHEDALRHLNAVRLAMRQDDRRLLEAYYEDGDSAAAAASVAGIEPRLVKVHLFRARSRMRTAVRRRLERQSRAPEARVVPCS